MAETNDLIKELLDLADPVKAGFLSKFFKTGKGQYAEGDVFLGITVPVLRKVVSKHLNLSLASLQKLLSTKIHEQRFVALQILAAKFAKAAEKEQREIFDFYIKNIRYINNWDLVDTSAPHIVGRFLMHRNKSLLYKFASSKNLWERRIAIISTMYFIKCGQFADTIKISEILLSDKHDLIHKAVGWTLREVGKKDEIAEKMFLEKYFRLMPRTMLRYSIERLSQKDKKRFMVKP